MEIRQLQYFISVGEKLNFTEAAKDLYVAQPAVSYQIAGLEKELGVKLLIRDKHSVRLTSAGKVLLKEAQIIVDKCYETIQSTQQADKGILGTLRVATLGIKVLEAFPILLRQFKDRYPMVKVDFEIMNADQITDGLAQGTIDVGFLRPGSVRKNPALTYEKVYTDYICAVLPAEHSLAERIGIEFTELAKEAFISVTRQHSASLFDVLIKLGSNRGFSPNIVNTAGQVESVLCMVEAGFGIAALPFCFLNHLPPGLRCIPIQGEDAYLDLAVGWNKNSANPSIPLFLSELKDFSERM